MGFISVAAEWLTMVMGIGAIEVESKVEAGNSDEKSEDEMFEDEEWNGIQDDMESDEKMSGKQKRRMKRRKRRWRVTNHDAFEEDDVDVSENEILYDNDGNICQEQDHRLPEGMGRYSNPSLKLLAKEKLCV